MTPTNPTQPQIPLSTPGAAPEVPASPPPKPEIPVQPEPRAPTPGADRPVAPLPQPADVPPPSPIA